MIFFRRRKHPAVALLEAPRAQVERVLGALPDVSLADVFVDLASRTGVDLGQVAERVFDRLGELAEQAADEAGELADSDTGHQLRDLAARAASRAAELAYRTGAERLLETVPRRRRSRRPLFLAGVIAGLAAGSAAAYFISSRLPEVRRRLAPARGPGEPSDATPSLSELPKVAAARVTAPAHSALASLQQRFRLAQHEARQARAETERELWRQYYTDVYHLGDPSTTAEAPPSRRISEHRG